MLIGKINDKKYQKLLVTLREVKGTKMIDFRIHHLGVDGELVATPAGVSLTVDQVGQAIELLGEAKKRVTEQG
jgi:Transcriptional Coactivator p15 (PC4)